MNTLEIEFEYREADKNDPMSTDEIDIGKVLINGEEIEKKYLYYKEGRLLEFLLALKKHVKFTT